MPNARGVLLAVVAAVAVLPRPAQAQDIIMGSWSLLFQIGADVELSGDVMQSASGTLLGFPASVGTATFKTAYDTPLRGQVVFAVGMSPRSEMIVRGSYSSMSGQAWLGGTFNGRPMLTELTRYKEWGMEVGYRRYLSVDNAVKPYISLGGGLRILEITSADFVVPDAEFALIDYPYWDGSRMGVFGGELGLRYDASEHVLLGVEVGIRYQTKPSASALPFPFVPSPEAPEIPAGGLEHINETGSRWSVPLLATLGFRF